MRRTFVILLSLLVTASALAQARLDFEGNPLPDRALARLGTTQNRIGKAVEAWALSRDGKTLAVEHNRHITLWDVVSGRSGRQFEKPANESACQLCYSADGRFLARLGTQQLHALNLVDGSWRKLCDRTSLEESIGFLSGKNELALTEKTNTNATIFDLDQNGWQRTLETNYPLERLSPSGKFFFGRVRENDHDNDQYVFHLQFVDAKSGQPCGRVSLHEGSFEKADQITDWSQGRSAVSPDDRRLYLTTEEGELVTYDIESGRRIETSKVPNWNAKPWDWPTVAVSGDGRMAYVVRAEGPVYRRDLVAKKWLSPPQSMPVGGAIVPLPVGRAVLQIADGVFRRIDLDNPRDRTPWGFSGSLQVAGSPDGRRVAVLSEGHQPRLTFFDVDGALLRSTQLSDAGGSIRWSPTGQRLVWHSVGSVAIFDAAGQLRECREHPEVEEGIRANHRPCGNGLPEFFSNLVLSFDPMTLAIKTTWNDLGAPATISPDGRRLVLSHREKSYLVEWPHRPKAFGPMKELLGWPSSRIDYAFTPDGSYLACFHESGWVGLRHPSSGEPQRHFLTDLRGVRSHCFSPGGQWLALGTAEGSISLWDLAFGQHLVTWQSDQGSIDSLSFVGSGKLVSTGSSLTALIWDLSSRKNPVSPVREALVSLDSREAARAIWAIASDPEGTGLLREWIAPTIEKAPANIDSLIANLGADRYVVRERATNELRSLNGPAISPLRKKLQATSSAEIRERAMTILNDRPRERLGIEVIHARAVMAMELSGASAATKLLEEWAAGDPELRLTLDAKAALGRRAR